MSAAPQDAQVVHGSAAIDQQGDLTTIQASHNSVINYSAFSILPQETVRFVQPGASSRVLNRVTGPERSLIQGHLQANGIVYLVNPAGVYFAKGSVVDVAGLYAAAGHISNEDYLAGNDLFAQVSGSVVNEGTLQGRAVHLIGRSVANRGSITASDGIVTLLAGDEVYVREQGGRVLVRIDGFDVGEGGQPSAGGSAPSTGGEAGVDQSGSIRADRGRVVLGAGDLYSLAVRNSGSVAAAGGGVRVAAADGAVVNTGRLSADTQSGQGGLVEVAAPSIVSSGSITADTHRGAAGSVRLVGHNHTYLLDGSRTSASGGSGGASGGGVLVNSVAGLTLFASGARIDVSSGRGLGSGGSVELSGVSMVFNGSVDLQGVSAHGSLLLDPGDLTVADIGTQDPLAGDGVIDFNEPDSVTDVTISDEALEAVVGHIRLAAARDLFVNHPVNLAGNNDLTLQANRHLQVNAAIQGSGGSGRFVATADADGDGAGDLALNAPVSGFLSATLDGAAVTLNATPIQTAGLQLYHAPVVLGADTTLIASGVRFKAAVDAAAGGEAPALTIEGSAAFDAPVGAVQPLQSLDVLGAATINGGVFSTVGPQSFRDAVTVNGDTTLNASGVTLGDSLDAAKAGVGAVTISGTALFSGPVGSTRALGSLDVVGETTIHGGSITTTGQQTYHQAVTVGREGVALGGSGVHFGSTVDLKEPDESEPGEGFVPVLEVSGTGFEIHGPRVMRDGVVVAVGTTLAAEGDDDGGEGTTEPGALQIHAGADGVFFGGEVGGSTALQSIGVVSAGLVTIRGDLVRTWGGISLNPQGVAEVPTVATIAAPAGGLRIQSVDGDVVMGQNQKLTALGDLTIEAAGRAALGDLNALGHTTVHASAIELQTREAGLVLNPQGGLDPDEGVDYVTGGNFDFNVAPTAVGEGGQPRFSAQGPASGPLASASNIVYLQHRGLSASQFTRGSTVLDLRATGSPAPPPDGSTNLSEALDGPVRRASFADDVLEELRLKEADAQALRELGIGARPLRGSEIAGGLEGRHFYDDTLVGTLGGGGEQAGVALPRLSRAPALEAARRYREVFFEQVVDDQTGELRWQDRSDYIRAVLEEAWNAYVASSPDAAADASGFRAYLGAQPDYASALRFLDHLSGLVAVLRSIGLTAREFQVCEVSLLNRVKPSSMDLEELERAIGGAVQQSAERDRGMVSVAGR